MNHLALFLAGALAAAPVAAAQIELTPEEAQQCEAGDGCLLVTVRQLRKVICDAHEAGKSTCPATPATT